MSTTLPPARSGGIYEAAFPKPEVVEAHYERDWALTRAQAVERGEAPVPLLATGTVTVRVTYDLGLIHPDEMARRILHLLHDGETLPGHEDRLLWRAERSHIWHSDRSWVATTDEPTVMVVD